MLIIVSILPQAPELQRLPTLRFVNISPKNWFLTMAHCIETILQEIHLSLRWVCKSGAWSQTSKHPHITFHVRLQNSFLVFLKIGLPRSTREILERISRASHAHVDREKKFRVSPQFHSLFSPSLRDFCLTAPALLTNAIIRTVLQSASIFDFLTKTTNMKRNMLLFVL